MATVDQLPDREAILRELHDEIADAVADAILEGRSQVIQEIVGGEEEFVEVEDEGAARAA